MSTKFAQLANIPTVRRNQPYKLHMYDGTAIDDNGGMVDTQTQSVMMWVGDHPEEVCFDIVGKASYDVTLGMPWVKEHDPVISWRKGELEFSNCNCTTVMAGRLPATDQPQNSKRNEVTETSRRKLQQLQKKQPGSVYCLWVRPMDTSLQILATTTGLNGKKPEPKIPDEYKEFEELFCKEKGIPYRNIRNGTIQSR